MSNPPELPEDNRGSVGSVGSGALFGGGVGTVLAVIAYNMGHDNPLKSWLTVLAPPFAVTITAIWAWGKTSLDERSRRKNLDAFYAVAKQTLDNAMANPHTSQEHKDKVRRELEEIELLVVRSLRTRVRRLV